jgi:chromosomal replication initiator protein
MQTSPLRLWDGVVCRLRALMPPFAHDAWIGPLVARIDGPGGLVLGCPTAFHRDRVRERFLPQIEQCAALEAGTPVAIDLVVAPPAPRAPHERFIASTCAPREVVSAPAPSETSPVRVAAPNQSEFPYRFDNFVVGSCNALAREAALSVARRSQRALNPLVLVSEAGLGKTHLARAIVNEARQQGETRAIYASAEAFTNEFTRSLQARRADEFKRRFRQGCRLLVIEDVQFFDARKRATQLELFHTVCHLLDVGARIVLTADRQPRDLDGLDARLRSTITSGLVAELDAPDALVRREILRQKAADGGVKLPDECRELIVESVRGSVRDLEGVLIQLVTTASLLKRPIDPELTLVALRKLAPLPLRNRELAMSDVVETVASYFKKRPDELSQRTRRRDVLVPRQLAMYLGHRYTGAALSVIGAALGRDHSAAAHAVRKIERQILERAPLRYQVEALCARLDGMVGKRRE